MERDSQFLILAPEFWAQVCELLSTHDLLNLRAVCNQLKEFVDGYINKSNLLKVVMPALKFDFICIL